MKVNGNKSHNKDNFNNESSKQENQGVNSHVVTMMNHLRIDTR
jgi:hypothetical protein